MADTGGLNTTQQQAQFEYDFAKYGGAVGDIELTELLPAGAVLTKAYIYVDTQLTSAGAAEIALKAEGAGDVLVAVVLGGFTTGALLDTVLDGTAANMVEITANKGLTLSITVAALTAGNMKIIVDYDYINYTP